MLQAMRHDFKLQLTHCAQQQQCPGYRPEHLNGAFFAKLRQACA